MQLWRATESVFPDQVKYNWHGRCSLDLPPEGALGLVPPRLGHLQLKIIIISSSCSLAFISRASHWVRLSCTGKPEPSLAPLALMFGASGCSRKPFCFPVSISSGPFPLLSVSFRPPTLLNNYCSIIHPWAPFGHPLLHAIRNECSTFSVRHACLFSLFSFLWWNYLSILFRPTNLCPNWLF